MVCSSKKLWLAAREELGLEGILPLANYDMSSAGLGNCVTARGIYELHNPGSAAIQIKMFSSINMSTATTVTKRLTLSDGDSAINVGDSLKDIVELESLKHALRALCTAAQLVCPWNHSFMALHGFLHSSQFGAKELQGQKDRVPALVDFVNAVFRMNANAWIQQEEFLSAGELKATWGDFIANRPSALLSPQLENSSGNVFNQRGGYNRGKQNFRGGRGGRGGSFYNSGAGTQQQANMPNTNVPPPAPQQPMTICQGYNNNTCQNHYSACFLPSGERAFHVCDVIKNSGRQCRGYHRKDQHR